MIGFSCIALAYLLGAIPTGYLLVRMARGEDIRRIGSGNIGATNVVRSMGLTVGLVVLAIDAVKGFAAVWLAGWISGGSELWICAAAVAVMLGNAFPVFLGFRGGKTFATALGAFLFIAPVAVAVEVPVFVLTVAFTRHISAGSIVVAFTFPSAVWIASHAGSEAIAAAALAALLILWRHKDNIHRLRAGTESVFSLGSGKRQTGSG